MNRIRANIRINGVVQGVGFRPFLHRHMAKYGLSGWIRNTSEGIEMEVEGSNSKVKIFADTLKTSAPPLASIDSIHLNILTSLEGYQGITILPSKSMVRRNTLISPDVAVCPDCLLEMNDINDRRYRYPFINCTNCGPRFSIIQDVPYDRANTTMASFAMCPDCAEEYQSIADRRYHAQPDCCGECGPKLFFLDGSGNPVSGDPIALAAQWLNQGKIIAVKGLGGIHLACRSDNPEIVNELRRRKRRDEKPLAVMCRDIETARRFCHISAEEALLAGHIRPIVLLRKKADQPLSHLSDNRYLGVMLPYTPVHHLLMESAPECLVMTSANISDLPIIIDNDDALDKLRGIADGFLFNNRDIENRCDDSLLWMMDGKPYPVRRSRGYVPFPLELKNGSGKILACGGEQKASFCISRRNQVFQSAHIGDLKNAETLAHYEKQIDLFQRLFDVRPEMIVCDLHPDYLSTEYAIRRSKAENIPLLSVQHHHAHMAACMADNELDGPCIGLIWDGTGYGSDGTIWGGECFIGDYSGFERFGSIRPVRLPGGDRAIREIHRIGISLLMDADIDISEFFPDASKIEMLLRSGLNCPESSGMGRLFDGICAIIGLRQTAGYEGQGAVLLESAADEDCSESYPFKICLENHLHRFDYRAMIKAVCEDVRTHEPTGKIAARFMNTLILMAREICDRARRENGLNRVVLSGGVFQNMYLLERLSAGLKADGFEVHRHSRVSTNDEGISFGQIAIAERSGGTYVPRGTAENY